MKKKILITGINGFIGQALWKYINKNQLSFEVFGLDIKRRHIEKNIFSCDLKKHRKLKALLTQIHPDYIFHFAGGRAADKWKIYEANFLTTKHLLDTVKEISDFNPRIIIPGSAAEYGKMPRNRRLIKEDDRPRPLNDYGMIKLQQTNLGLEYAQQGLDVVVARMFNISGSGIPSTLAVGKFVEQIVMIERGLRKKIVYTKNLDGKRDYLDIDDVCRALLQVAQHGRSGQIYNICSGRSISVRDLLKQLLSYAEVKGISVKENKNAAWPSFDVIGSNARLKSVAQWSSRVSVEKSLKNALQNYRIRE